MKIVICDDCIEDLIKIEKLVTKYFGFYPNTNYDIEKFSDAQRLYNKIQDRELADIYILDIMMSRKSGVDLGNQLRKAGNESSIIYVTSSDDFALDAYSVHAIRYLLKPVSEHKFFEALDYAMSYTEVKKGAIYMLKTKDGLVPVPYSKIEYIENSSRILEVHMIDGAEMKSIFIRRSFDEEIHEIAEDQSFIQVHKSFLVNLRCIKKLGKNSIEMESGICIPGSKKRIADVKKEYILFVSEQYR